jgi:hypothetical protein
MDLSFLHAPGKTPKGTFAKIIFITVGIIIIWFIWLLVTSFTSQTFGLSNNSVVVSAPSMGYPSPMVPSRVIAQKGGGVAYGESADMYQPVQPIPGDIAGSPNFPAQRSIIRTASLSLVVEDVSKSAKDIADLSGRLGGWVENQNVYEYTTGSLQGSLTVRVLEPKFSEALAQIKLLAVRVQNEQISSNDVSAQVVDLESRLKNERAKEAQYLVILKSAVKISDILEVTNMLSSVRGTIEQIQGQINYLGRQTSMSTISVSLTPVANAKEVTNEWKPMLIVKESFKNLLMSLTGLASGLIVFVIQVLPMLILQLAFFALFIIVVWKLAKKLFAKLSGTPLTPKV